MIVGQPSYSETTEHFRATVQVQHAGGVQDVWFEVERVYAAHVMRGRLDAFLLAALMLGMKQGEDIHLQGDVSHRLVHYLNCWGQHVIRQLQPDLKIVKITADQTVDSAATCKPSGVVTGFSGGVDSFCAIVDHFINEPDERYRVTHLVFNNVGAFRQADERSLQQLQNRINLLRRFPEEVNLPLVVIDSNVAQLMSCFVFDQFHSLANSAAVHFLPGLFGKYYYASGCTYANCILRPARDIALTDPVLVPMLSSESLRCIPTGSQYTKAEKTKRISEYEPAQRYLNVCTVPGLDARNCSQCNKCMRTLLNLELLGVVEQYGQVFDLDVYAKSRKQALRFLSRSDTSWIEMRQLYRQTRGHIPVPARFAGILMERVRKMGNRNKRLKKWLLARWSRYVQRQHKT